jgi:hypothetical protein
MSPTILLAVLVACLLALLPIWRLHVAGWSPRSLFTAWIAYILLGLVLVAFPGTTRFLLPILVLAVIAPFVAGPERLTRVLGGRGRRDGVIINVTPRPAPRLPAPRPDGEVGDETIGPETTEGPDGRTRGEDATDERTGDR